MGVYDREGELSQINAFGRKMKLLEVMRILETETDPDHPLTANQIARKLERKGFATADRKGIYDDINVLNRFYKADGKRKAANAPRIEKDEGTWGYYLDNRPFSVADLNLSAWSLFIRESEVPETRNPIAISNSLHPRHRRKVAARVEIVWVCTVIFHPITAFNRHGRSVLSS